MFVLVDWVHCCLLKDEGGKVRLWRTEGAAVDYQIKTDDMVCWASPVKVPDDYWEPADLFAFQD